jgi:hypothetical protein
MGNKRLRAVSVPLTEGQREVLRAATGQQVSEAIFAGLVPDDAKLMNEITEEEDPELLVALRAGTDFFLARIDSLPGAKQLWESYIEHGVHEVPPPMIFLR